MIAEWPDGVYRSRTWSTMTPMGRRGSLSAVGGGEGRRLEIDFSDSDPQCRGPINCPDPLDLRRRDDGRSMRAWGNDSRQCRPVPGRVGDAKPGTFVSPVEPAATCNRALTLARVADVVFGALAQVVPERVPPAPNR